MKYKCIIFDCDGVLVDSETLSNTVLIDMAKSVGLVMDLHMADKYFTGKSLARNFEYIEKKISKKLPYDFEKNFRKKSFAVFKNNLQPIDGVHDLLNRLTIPYCVASSGPLEKIKLNLTTTKLIDKFDNNIFSCYEIQSWKPEPTIFLHAAEKMGFQPSECVVVEDSISGVHAAKAGGFDVYAYAQDRGKTTFEDMDVTVFYDMNKLDTLLKI